MITLVTGASSGIGLEFSKLLVKDGHTVIAVAHDSKKLENAAKTLRSLSQGAAVETIAVDLSDQRGPMHVAQEVKKRGLAVDCLINNAGIGLRGAFETTSLDAHMQLIRTNIVTLTQLTHFFLPQMIERGSGKILNVASTAAFQPGPYMSTYYASKAYVLSFSESLKEEVADLGITVTTLCPGPTDTNFAKRADVADTPLFQSLRVQTAESVARRGYQALLAGEGVVVTGAGNKLFVGLSRFVPRGLSARVVKRLQQREKRD